MIKEDFFDWGVKYPVQDIGLSSELVDFQSFSVDYGRHVKKNLDFCLAKNF